MEDSYSSRQVRSRVVRLMLAAKRNAVEDIRLKGVDKFSVVTFEMARLPAAAVALGRSRCPRCTEPGEQELLTGP